MRRNFFLLGLAAIAGLWVFLVSLAGGPARAGEAGDPSVISYGSQVRGGPPPHLVFLYSSEVMGWTEPCG
ncbi:MAG TPA: hypothetical protein VGR38_07925 [Candidatus Polarisedimenticolia bacterium]|nr:hypothetical protein [Candidatus Polarisedimenticolia bacterium]